MSRKDELLKVFEGVDDAKDVILPLIDDVVFLEGQLDKLRKLPFIRVSSKDPAIQKATPASKLYKEMLQQYGQCIKILTGVLRKDGTEEESPLRAYLKSRQLDS